MKPFKAFKRPLKSEVNVPMSHIAATKLTEDSFVVAFRQLSEGERSKEWAISQHM